MESKVELDAIAWTLLEALQEDARLSFAELGRRVNLSPPAVAERVRRLEEAGVIRGYQAVVDPAALGYELAALIELTTTPQEYGAVTRLLEEMEEVRRCCHVTGQGSFRIEAIAQSISHLEEVIGELSRYGQTATAIVLSQPVKKHSFARPDEWSS